MALRASRLIGLAFAFATLFLAACSPVSFGGNSFSIASFAPTPAIPSAQPPEELLAYAEPEIEIVSRFNDIERECLIRAMYFESHRSSTDGMMAVGTVVMNRVDSSSFPNSICGVVGAPNQFGSGILSNPMTEEDGLIRAGNIADRLLAGERHAGVRTAKYFHQAGLHFPYRNMHYVLEAGGNAFYMRT